MHSRILSRPPYDEMISCGICTRRPSPYIWKPVYFTFCCYVFFLAILRTKSTAGRWRLSSPQPFSAVLYAIDGHWPAFYRAKLHLYRRCVAPQLATDEANEVFCRPLERFVATLVCVWLADQCRAVRCRCLPCVHRHSPAVTPSLLAARQVSLEQIKRLG